MKKILLLCLVAWFYQPLTIQAQQSFYLSIQDTTIISGVSESGIPVFTVRGINTILGNYQINQFERVFPNSDYLYSRNLWTVTADTNLAIALINAYPQYFRNYLYNSIAVTSEYIPNDPEWVWQKDFLRFIKASNAWSITKGDSNIAVGVTDLYFDTSNIDLVQNIHSLLGGNVNIDGHGTPVAGIIGAKADNYYLCTGVAFRSKLDLYSARSDFGMRALASHRNFFGKTTRVLNGSWLTYSFGVPDSITYDTHQALFPFQQLYNDIYEDGVVACFAAGNGYRGAPYQKPSKFVFPASLDHNISVTGVYHFTDTATNVTAKQFERMLGYPDSSYMYNAGVDICAPATGIPTLGFDENNPSIKTTNFWHTSAAAPQVAGAAALIASAKPCLSPYQIEYLLKKHSDSTVYNLPQNAPYKGTDRYHGKIGAGILDVEWSVSNAQNLKCDDPSTQTLYIEGIQLNHRCRPGRASNGSKPQLSLIVRNANGNLTCRWDPVDPGTTSGNNVRLSSVTTLNPTIDSSWGNHLMYYRVTVYDGSEVQKVASRMIRIQLYDKDTADLASRDSYMDMLDEPNKMAVLYKRDWQIWQIPDIWNQTQKNSITAHENPEFRSNPADSNYICVKVRNMGCVPSDRNNRVRFYWTLAATGEKWPSDWTSSFINTSAGFQPIGRELPMADSLQVLQPGDSIIVMRGWNPPNPNNYDGLAGSPIGICLLSRIVAFYKTIVGSQQIERNMRFAETDTVKHNIANNNNIVTRNTILINLGRKIAPTGGVRIYVSGNTVDAVAQKVRLEMITDKDYQFHFAGNLSDYLYVKLYLAPTLYDRWAAGGYKGNVAGHNPDDHSVVYDPSVPLVLDGITLAQDEILPVDVSFILRDGAGIPFDLTNHVVHFRQLGVVDDNPEKPLHELLGNISFLLNIKADEPEENKPASTLQITTPQSNAYCKLYPNPFTDIVYIQYLGKEDAWVSTTVTDITGRTVLTIPASLYKPGITTELHTQQLYAGIYFIRLTNSKGQNTVYKMTKIK